MREKRLVFQLLVLTAILILLCTLSATQTTTKGWMGARVAAGETHGILIGHQTERVDNVRAGKKLEVRAVPDRRSVVSFYVYASTRTKIQPCICTFGCA